MRPERLELPAYWFEANGPCIFSNLEALPTIANNCDKLLVFKDFQEVRAGVLATARNASMQGVGTKLGTVESRDSGVMGQANIGISGQHGTYKTYKTPPCSVRRVSGVPPRLHHFAADKRRWLATLAESRATGAPDPQPGRTSRPAGPGRSVGQMCANGAAMAGIAKAAGPDC